MAQSLSINTCSCKAVKVQRGTRFILLACNLSISPQAKNYWIKVTSCRQFPELHLSPFEDSRASSNAVSIHGSIVLSIWPLCWAEEALPKIRLVTICFVRWEQSLSSMLKNLGISTAGEHHSRNKFFLRLITKFKDKLWKALWLSQIPWPDWL